MFSKTFKFTKLTLVVSVAVCGLFVANQANAQEFPAPVKKTTETVYQSKLPLSPEMKAQMKPGIRYTVGSVTKAGWHKGLVKGNKNLGHYFWAPMNHMVQASSSQKTKVQAFKAPTRKRSFHYIKPVHKANPLRPGLNLPPKVAKAKKIDYIHKNVSSRIRYKKHNKQVQAKLRYSRPKRASNVDGRLISKNTQARVYAGDYSANKNATGYLSSKDAYGKILND